MTSVNPDGTPLPFYLSDPCFWHPRDVVESAWLEHAPFAFWLIEALEPRSVVELGTHNGFSYLCFCQAVHRLGLSTAAWAIDTWRGDEHAGFYGDEVLDELRSAHDPTYASFSRLVQSTFDDALEHFDTGSIDLLHIDGRHFYDDVKHDFEAWLPKMSDRSVVLVHDINVKEREFGVDRMWGEIVGHYDTFEFRHGHGLGVAAIGAEQPARVRQLVETGSDSPDAHRIRAVYQRLGVAVSATDRVQALEREVRALAQTSDEYWRLRESVQGLHDALREADDQRQADAAQLHEALADNKVLRAHLASADAECERLRADVAHLATSNDEAAKAAAEVRTQLAEVQSRLDDAQLSDSELRAELEGIYSSRTWRIASLGWRLRSRD